MPLAARQAVLQSWCSSRLSAFQKGYKALKSLIACVLLSHIDPATGTNPLFKELGYTPGSVMSEASAGPRLAAAAQAEEVLASATVHMPDVASMGHVNIQAYLSKKGFSTVDVDSIITKGKSAPQDVPDQRRMVELDYDAVIVGSGAGGGVTAALLAAAGMRVLVLEKSSWVRSKDMTWLEDQAFTEMYERGGFMISADASLTLLAGSTLGGGTKINWTASLKPPHHLRHEWAEVHGLPVFAPGSAAFDEALEAVCKRLGVSQGTEMSASNQKLLQGLQVLGLHGEELPRNCLSKSCHACCNLGCRTGHKQSSDICWLVDAVRAGAHILTGVQGQRVVTAQVKLLSLQNGTRSKEVAGLVASVASNDAGTNLPQLLIHAPIVVSSCGALHSPALLLRSGITVQGNVGRHLRVHPAGGVVGQFQRTPEQAAAGKGAIEMHQGVSMGSFSRAAAGWTESGYGAMFMHKYFFLGVQVSIPAVQPGLLAAITPDCRPGMKGPLSFKGIELAMKALLAAGAVRVTAPNADGAWDLQLDPSQPLEQRLKNLDDLVRLMRKTGIRKYDFPLFSAHQMGSCRMGSSPQVSVCDSSGECWEVSGLYIADASAFPTASGVNPMITVYGLSYLVASGLASRWKSGHKAASAH
eukprot:gene7933-8129_t